MWFAFRIYDCLNNTANGDSYLSIKAWSSWPSARLRLEPTAVICGRPLRVDQISFINSLYEINETMDYQKLCESIRQLDTMVRYVGVCNETGEIIHGGLRDGLTNLLSPEETKKSNLLALERWKLHNALAPKIGKVRYAMEEYEKIKQFTIGLENDHLLLMSTEVDADQSKIIEGAIKLIISHYVQDYL